MTKETDFIAGVRALLATYDTPEVVVPPPSVFKVGFMGDSHAANREGIPTWPTLLNRTDITNRAVSGARAFEIRTQHELDPTVGQIAEIIKDAPKACFIMIGKNDSDAIRSAAEIIADSLYICQKLKAANITPILCTEYFVASGYVNGASINTKLNQVHEGTYTPCVQNGYKWLNLVQYVCGAGNVMLAVNTSDSCHLNTVGQPKVVPGMVAILQTLGV